MYKDTSRYVVENSSKMTSQVKVKKTSSKTADIINPILIDVSSTTRRLLIAKIVENEKDPDACISATIIHQRKGKNEQWEDVEAINLQKLKAGEGVKLHFGCTQLKQLREAIEKAYTCGNKGVLPTGQYIFGKQDEFIIPVGKEGKYIQSLLERNYGENIWEQLVELDPDLATRLSYAQIHSERQKAIEEFENSIQADLDEDYWQKFLSKNDWIFGYGLTYNMASAVTEQVYVGGKKLNNKGGHLCDFLATSNGNVKYTALVEIKTPKTRLLGAEDRNGVYPISQDFAKAISQVQVYCSSWGTNAEGKTEAEQEYDALTVRPKGILVIGNSAELNTRDQKNAFELFRRGISSIDIITYDELLERARYILLNKA